MTESAGDLKDLVGGTFEIVAEMAEQHVKEPVAEKAVTETASTDTQSTAINEVKVDLKGCPVESVVVYSDRADVRRLVETSVLKGINHIILHNASGHLDSESIRVEGHGRATINDVFYKTRHEVIKKDEPMENVPRDNPENIRRNVAKLREKKKPLEAKKERLTHQRKLLDAVVSTIGSQEPPKSQTLPSFCSPDYVTNLDGVLSFYGEKTSSLDAEILQVGTDLQDIDDEIRAFENTLEKVHALSGYGETTEVKREIVIILEAADDGPVKLLVSYVVHGASWSPKYDLRVFSKEKLLKIYYYGVIRQSTDEDWMDTKLALSTATPSIGGHVPELKTLNVGFHRPPVQTFVKQKRIGFSFRAAKSSPMPVMADSMSMPMSFAEPMALECAMDVVEAQVEESIASTTYEIPRPGTIKCDSSEHKVTIAIIDLQPAFSYESVPKKASHAFLKAKVKNDSLYALLAGPTSIFLDNNFVAKATLKAVSPKEEFECSLGVDPAVRITYHPVQKMREKSGIISKTVSTQYVQRIEIKNTHQYQIKILVTDQLPRSSEDKIKVLLQEPPIRHDKPEKGDPNIRLTKSNNIEWELEIAPAASHQITLSYAIEHPASEEVELHEN